MDIVVRYPDPNAGGYFKFLRRMAICDRVLTRPGGCSVEEIDQAVDSLLEFVEQPIDRDEARNLLLEMSAGEIAAFVQRLNPGVDPKASAKSGAG